jgi:DNA processing protein
MKIGKINSLSIANFAYAHPLETLHTPPKQLFCAGKLPEKRRPTVAIVGSRKPTAYGMAVTQKLAYELARNGVVIVSGLAYGIDAIAHQAALEAGGTTIGILAGGLHAIYPSAHTQLAERIVRSGGALLSEQPLGYNAHKYHFLARNRLVSGLADALLITEATERSGTTSTVAHAIEQHIPVFAVPGPIDSLLSAGPNRLIQQGAQVVLTAQDILDIIAPHVQLQQTRFPLGENAAQATIIQLIQKGIQDGEALQEASQLSTSEYLQALTMLEINNVIRPLGANRWGIR